MALSAPHMYLVGATRRPIAILPPIFIPAGLRSFFSVTFTYFYFDGQQQTNQLNLTEIGSGIFMEILKHFGTCPSVN